VVIADNPALAEIIADEVNVKEVTGREVADGDMLLDTELTDELREEGDIRELIRRIQEMRKHSGLTPKDAVILQIDTTDRGREILGRHETSVLGTVRAKSVEYLSLVSADEIMLGGETLGFALKRVQ
jgi:isoleucyl-tRNA synthetase